MDTEAADTDLDWIRRQLVAIDDQIRTLGPDDLALGHSLRSTADGLRNILRAGSADTMREVRAEWSTRAGRKGGHEVDYEALAGMVRSMQPGESGR